MKLHILKKNFYCVATLLAVMTLGLSTAEAERAAIVTAKPSSTSAPTATETPYIPKNSCESRSGNEEFTIPSNARNSQYRRSSEVAVCALQKEAARALCAESLSHVTWVSTDGGGYHSSTLVKNRCDCPGTNRTSFPSSSPAPCKLKVGLYEATDSKNALTVSSVSVEALQERKKSKTLVLLARQGGKDLLHTQREFSSNGKCS